MNAEHKIKTEREILKTELMREIKTLFASISTLISGSAERLEDSELENLSAEKLLQLRRKLKQKLDGAASVAPTADVRFKSQQK